MSALTIFFMLTMCSRLHRLGGEIIDYQVMPPLSNDEYDRLKEDIQENGQLIPIEVDEFGNILDGYNRMKICKELELKPLTVVRAGLTEDEKWLHALSLNVNRRQLTGEQYAGVIRDFVDKHGRISNRRIADALNVNEHRVADTLRGYPGAQNAHLDTVEGYDGKSYPESAKKAEQQRESIRDFIKEHPSASNGQVAKATGASPTTVATQRKKTVTVYNPSSRDQQALKDPDIVRRMAETGSNVAGAIREQKRDQLVEHLESVETREAKAVAGVYDVVVIDPPWPMQKIERDERPNQAEFDYPTMSIDEIKALKVPAADDCHIFLWTTVKFLFDAKDILDTWGFKYVCPFIWHKPGGFQPIGLPMYNIEICLYAHKGAPKFVDLKSFCLGNSWPTRGHSVKPEEFYEMLRRVTAGRRLDMFNRRKIEGFDSWGKEATDVD